MNEHFIIRMPSANGGWRYVSHVGSLGFGFSDDEVQAIQFDTEIEAITAVYMRNLNYPSFAREKPEVWAREAPTNYVYRRCPTKMAVRS